MSVWVNTFMFIIFLVDSTTIFYRIAIPLINGIMYVSIYPTQDLVPNFQILEMLMIFQIRAGLPQIGSF